MIRQQVSVLSSNVFSLASLLGFQYFCFFKLHVITVKDNEIASLVARTGGGKIIYLKQLVNAFIKKKNRWPPGGGDGIYLFIFCRNNMQAENDTKLPTSINLGFFFKPTHHVGTNVDYFYFFQYVPANVAFFSPLIQVRAQF